MKTLKHTCENCDSSYKITWDENQTEDDPKFCPVCAEYILDDTEDIDCDSMDD